MDSYNELLLKAVSRNDISGIKYCLKKGANVNKICSGGVTPLGLAAQTGNISILKLLAESTRNKLQLDIENENCSKPLYLSLDLEKPRNIGYFVVCKDLDDNELEDGTTPDGMDALEWDMEITEENVEEIPPSPEINIYKWYAKILNQTSIILKSPEYDISRLDTHGQNVLHYAVRIGNKEMVDYLLNTFTEINVDQCDSSWCSPLHLACADGCIELINLLISRGANVNATNTNKETPLHFAAHRGFLDVTKLLVENGANVNVYDLEERSPLSIAIASSHEEVAEYLIGKSCRLNHEDMLGYTPLHNAVSNGMCNIARLLLEGGAKIIHSRHLLHLATQHNNLEMISLLHSAGAVVNSRDHRGNTPLMFACINKNIDIAEYFLKHGAPVNATNQVNGMTALHLCVQAVSETDQFKAFLELFLNYQVDINSTSFQGNVLFYSIILGNLSAAILLVKYGADVNRRDEHAYFDNLSLAKKQGNLELVKLIILAGFNFKNMMFDMKTLKHHGDDPIYEFLVQMRMRPLCLRELCRIKIRRTLGNSMMKKIYQLPLPFMIHDYLALEIL